MLMTSPVSKLFRRMQPDSTRFHRSKKLYVPVGLPSTLTQLSSAQPGDKAKQFRVFLYISLPNDPFPSLLSLRTAH